MSDQSQLSDAGTYRGRVDGCAISNTGTTMRKKKKAPVASRPQKTEPNKRVTLSAAWRKSGKLLSRKEAIAPLRSFRVVCISKQYVEHRKRMSDTKEFVKRIASSNSVKRTKM